MNSVLAILILAVVCVLAAPVVLGVLLRVIVFAACLVISLLLREFVAEGILFLFPVGMVVAEVSAVVLLYLALRSLLRRCLQWARSATTLNSWKVIGIDLVSVAIPGSLLLVGFGGIFMPGTMAWHGAGLFIVFVAAIGMAGLDIIFPRAFWMLSGKVWGSCSDVQTGKEMIR